MATQKKIKSSRVLAPKGKPSKVAPLKKSASKAQPKAKTLAKSVAPKPKSINKTAQAAKAKKLAPVAKKKTPVAKKAAKVVKKTTPIIKKAVPATKKVAPKPVSGKSSVSKTASLKAKTITPAQTKRISSPAIKSATKSVPKPVTKVAAQHKTIAVATPKTPVKTQVKPISFTGKIETKPVEKAKHLEILKPVQKSIPEKPVSAAIKPSVKPTGSKSSDLAKPTVSSKPMVEKPKEEQPKPKGFQRKSLKQSTAHSVKPFDIMSDKKEIKPTATMYSDEPHKTRYNDKELEEFDQLIDQKLIVAREQLEFYLKQLEDMAENPDNKIKGLDDGLSTLESERVSSMAARQQKLIQHLENAKIRIKNKVYGICRETGRLISKERLRAVPHATLSIEAKQAQN